MLGIFTGMKITLKHFFGHKVTRLYPYEKRELPPRSRGLIHYLRDENGQFKCEGCLFCEKVCPPQAITIRYHERQTHRDRPLKLPQATWGNFTRSRRALLSHQGRPELAVDQVEPGAGEAAVEWQRVTAALDGERAGGGLVAALGEIQATVGYLPRHAVARLADEAGVDLSTAYSVATAFPGFHTSAPTDGAIAVCQCPVCRSAGGKELAKVVADEAAATGTAVAPAASRARCLGDSRQAPVMRVGGKVYGDLTPEAARQIIREFLTVGG